MMKAAVIGGGISGLTSAYLLKSKGFDVTVFEKNSFAGGNIRTDIINGFLVEHGPSSTLETSPLIDVLLNGLGISDRKIYAADDAKKRYILKNGKLYALPLGPLSFLKTGLFSFSAKMRLLKEPFIKSKSDDTETIGEFTKRRLGKEFLDYAINPFVAGVFAGDPFNLNVKAAFPKLYELEQDYGGLIKGMIKSRKKRKTRGEESKQSAKTFSFKNGLIELVNAILSKLKDSVLLDTEVTEIIKSEDSFKISYLRNNAQFQETFDIVIAASPAQNASKLLHDFDNLLASDLEKVYYPPVAVITTGFRNDMLGYKPDGFGFLVPEKENRKILGSLWNSVIFKGRAPEGYQMLTNFIGGSRQPQLAMQDDDVLLGIVLDELKPIMGLKGNPDFVKIIKWQKAIPQYSKNYTEVIRKIEKFYENNPGIFICSNYYKGISVCDCIKNAFGTVDKIIEYSKTNQTLAEKNQS